MLWPGYGFLVGQVWVSYIHTCSCLRVAGLGVRVWEGQVGGYSYIDLPVAIYVVAGLWGTGFGKAGRGL